MNFQADEERKMLFGPFLIPNKLIYRRDNKNGEYYVRFSAQEIEKIARKFNETQTTKSINLMHTDEMVDAFVAETWIVEGENDKSKGFGFDLPEGTWFGGVKIKDTDFWESKVKANELKGFSVEILADLELSLKNKQYKMEKELDFGSTMLGDGTTPIYYDGEEIAIGTKIFTDEAMTMPAADDRWVLENGKIIVVINGEVNAIEEKEVEAEMATEEPITPMAQPGETQGAASITSEEVSLMIDSRFQELMNEITALKSMMGDKEKEYEDYKKQVAEKFSQTPAKQSVVKTDIDPKLEKFSLAAQRVREFAKIK